MGKLSTRKGHADELALGRWLERFGFLVEYHRGSGAVKDRGADLSVLGWRKTLWKRPLLFEAKHGTRDYLSLSARNRFWTKLAEEAAVRGGVPVLAYRMNRWRGRMFRVPLEFLAQPQRDDVQALWMEVPESALLCVLAEKLARGDDGGVEINEVGG